jgi:hypothetical protein
MKINIQFIRTLLQSNYYLQGSFCFRKFILHSSKKISPRWQPHRNNIAQPQESNQTNKQKRTTSVISCQNLNCKFPLFFMEMDHLIMGSFNNHDNDTLNKFKKKFKNRKRNYRFILQLMDRLCFKFHAI